MATRNARRKSATGATEKKGKGKWIVIFLLLILLAALAWYFLFNSAEKNFFSDFLPGSDATDMITVEKDKQLSMETISQSESKVDASIEDSPPQPPPPKKPKKKKKQYFIKLGSCLSDLCQREYKRQLKRVKLSIFQRKRSHRTTYFELISESAYPYARARQKVKIINKYNNKIGFPHIVKHKDQYRISFGQFPKKENAQTMKSHLAHLYPQVNMRFLMEPRSSKFTEVNLYTGPFSKSVAEKMLIKVQQIPDFEFATITSKL